MQTNQDLTARIRQALSSHETAESPLLGGDSFWVDDRLVVSTHEDGLLVRVPSDEYGELVRRPGATPYEFAARPVRDWVVVAAEALSSDETLAEWVGIGLTRSD